MGPTHSVIRGRRDLRDRTSASLDTSLHSRRDERLDTGGAGRPLPASDTRFRIGMSQRLNAGPSDCRGPQAQCVLEAQAICVQRHNTQKEHHRRDVAHPAAIRSERRRTSRYSVNVIRCLGPEGFGQWSTATALVSALAVITSFGFRPLFTRAVAQRPELAPNEVRYQLGLRTVLGLVAFAAAAASAVALGYPRAVLLCTLITGAAAIATGAAGALEDLLQGFQELKQVALVALVAGLTLTALSAFVAFLGGGAVSIAVAYAAGPAVSVVLLVGFVRTPALPVFPLRSICTASARWCVTHESWAQVSCLPQSGTAQKVCWSRNCLGSRHSVTLQAVCFLPTD